MSVTKINVVVAHCPPTNIPDHVINFRLSQLSGAQFIIKLQPYNHTTCIYLAVYSYK